MITIIYFYCDFYFPCFAVRPLLTAPVYFPIFSFFQLPLLSRLNPYRCAQSPEHLSALKSFSFFSFFFRKHHNIQCCIAVWAVWRKWTKHSLFVWAALLLLLRFSPYVSRFLFIIYFIIGYTFASHSLLLIGSHFRIHCLDIDSIGCAYHFISKLTLISLLRW